MNCASLHRILRLPMWNTHLLTLTYECSRLDYFRIVCYLFICCVFTNTPHRIYFVISPLDLLFWCILFDFLGVIEVIVKFTFLEVVSERLLGPMAEEKALSLTETCLYLRVLKALIKCTFSK